MELAQCLAVVLEMLDHLSRGDDVERGIRIRQTFVVQIGDVHLHARQLHEFGCVIADAGLALEALAKKLHQLAAPRADIQVLPYRFGSVMMRGDF